MPLPENKKRFAEGLGPIPKKRLEDARQLYLNAVEEGDDYKKNSADALITEFNYLPLDTYDINKKNKMNMALENLEKFGTTDFVYMDDNHIAKHPSAENVLHPQLAIRAINALISAATDFYDVNREFALKVAGAAWKMKKEHAAYLNMDPDNYKSKTTERLKELADEKNARGISNKSVSPKQDYVLRSTKGMDMFRDVQRQHNAGKLSWFRGSPEYKRIGTQLSEIHRDWVDFLGTEASVNGKKPDTVTVQDHQTLKEKAQQLKQKLETLKQYDQAYYDHKIRDGQFMTGRNSNADKRIAVVDNVDKLADFLIETMARREKMADDQIKEMNKQQELIAEEQNIIALPDENGQELLDSAKSMEDLFAPKKDELIKENDENNIINENNIENENNIINKEDINNIIIEEKSIDEKEMILNDSNIFEEKKIIEEEKPKTAQEKAQELIDKKRTEAQKNIRKATENGKKPDENLLKESCAAIATCFFLQASISKYEKNSTVNVNHLAPSSLDEKLYDTFYKNTLRSKTFRTMMKNTDSDTLISQATHEKGQNIYTNYENTKKLIYKPKEKVNNIQNNNSIVKNNEIKNNL